MWEEIEKDRGLLSLKTEMFTLDLGKTICSTEKGLIFSDPRRDTMGIWSRDIEREKESSSMPMEINTVEVGEKTRKMGEVFCISQTEMCMRETGKMDCTMETEKKLSSMAIYMKANSDMEKKTEMEITSLNVGQSIMENGKMEEQMARESKEKIKITEGSISLIMTSTKGIFRKESKRGMGLTVSQMAIIILGISKMTINTGWEP